MPIVIEIFLNRKICMLELDTTYRNVLLDIVFGVQHCIGILTNGTKLG